jgi:hypothetical protein
VDVVFVIVQSVAQHARAIAPIIAAQPATDVARLAARTARQLDLHHATVTGILADVIAAGAAHPTRPAGRNQHTSERPTRPGGLHRAAYPTTIQADLEQPPDAGVTPSARQPTARARAR